MPSVVKSSDASVAVALHPLPLLNISNFYTRAVATSTEFAGALLGTQDGRQVSIDTSFEFKIEDGVIDKELVTRRLAQFQQVMPELHFVGWFYVSKDHTSPTDEVTHLQKQLMEFDEAPLVLLIQPGSDSQQLPLHVYEPIIDSGETKYREATVVIETGEAERVAVEDLVRETSQHAASERVRQHLVSQHAAVKIFNGRVKTVLDYVKGVNEGSIVPDQRLLRSLRSILSQLSASSNSELKDSLQESQALTAAFLATVFQGTQLTASLKAQGLLMDRPAKKSLRRRRGEARDFMPQRAKKWDGDTDDDFEILV
ncbi:hypothetical protein B0I72DRAFT_134858 [Yarrowia lipolytica]|jgi:COP9 signalosome complex subunit 6|uniref:COP9 signalosome complex subunit 6 n=2 Tax=Yarrowia lipolytica TaxID=4952 RepID=Q6C7M5_YARLI|nr:YALI0D26884p [Yarrowia lipolytica CLIB122]AOW04702.1 hypothetical protein YALI1_D35424g [Yarrowia lipolytica]KAB8283970.1 hypothetical protein BKA91DRAFT_135987 [Yarrowia lipolytica]KAE8172149.1 hypothetical protein BKA90DRAFT_137863 [Yarrowia lipolytica]KAJ8053875.1 hypothetical protein LXG23DRAFT_20928 [Yarrowia lipolytica]QNP98157.1 COP9 signalosome complex subunit 6 [Yarrowia lipolytica]|eukprot:XP_503337.1 YALI0D26884p [Yarrowia lipolytica CLIB122]